MQTPAVGDGPISFVDSNGKQHAIPLSAIFFEDGAVQSEVDADGLDEWLSYLVAQRQLVPGPAPAAVDAMVFEATSDGPSGNDIVVEVREIAADTVKIVVRERHRYEGLTFGTSDQSVATVLGDAAKGVVHQTTVTGTDGDVPAEGVVAKSKLAPDDRPGWILADQAAASLAVLEPRGAGWDKGTLVVVVDEVDPIAGTFALQVDWEITSTVTAAGLTGVNPFADLGFAVTVKPPAPGGPLRLPRAGRVTLQGGAARVPETPPKKARVTLLADA